MSRASARHDSWRGSELFDHDELLDRLVIRSTPPLRRLFGMRDRRTYQPSNA